MELKLVNGDYVPNGAGGLCGLTGSQEVLSRVLYRLTARRGALPFLPNLGSKLHLVLREKPSERQALAAQYVAQALEEESEVKVERVLLHQEGERAQLTVELKWRGEMLSASVELG